MGSLSLVHWLVVLAIALLLFGNRLPSLGKSLGEGICNFNGGLGNNEDETDAQAKGPTPSNKQLPGPGESSTTSTTTTTTTHENSQHKS